MRDQRLHANAVNAVAWGTIIGIAAAGLWLDNNIGWAWLLSVVAIVLAAAGTAILLVLEGHSDG